MTKISTWMAPGNSKIFDGNFKSKTKMNLRTIGVLEYIKEKSFIKGYVSKKEFESEIKDYLFKKYGLEKNKSIPSHFYRTSLFYGFISINKNNLLRLTVEGGEFLNFYYKKDYKNMKKFFINQLDNVYYPNIATKKTYGLYLFPFRLVFKIFLDNKKIPVNFIKTTLVNIKKYDDLSDYLKTGNLEIIKQCNPISEREKKWYTWVFNSLKNIEIFFEKDGYFYLHNDVEEQVKLLFSNIEYKDIFFNDTNIVDIDNINEQIAIKRYSKRDISLIQLAKERDLFKCVRNNEHKTFISNKKQYVEGHHLLPFHQQKNFNFKIDDVDNIVSLCPICHREIHFSDDKKEIIDILFKERKIFFDKHNLKVDVLYKIYNV